MIYSRIQSNKRNSIILSILFILMIGILLGSIGQAFGAGAGFGIFIFAFIISIIGAFFGYYYSDKIVLGISRAHAVERSENIYLYDTLDGLAIASGIPTPKAYIIEDSAMNAFATGRDPEHAVICVTSGLLKRLNKQELEAVISHEMSHIKNYDIRFMALVSVLVGIIAMVSNIVIRSFFWGGMRGGNRDERKGGSAIFLAIAILLAILTPIIATLIKLAISRKREFLADADGALLTKNPSALANALEKIAKDTEPLEAANQATAHLYIENPLHNQKSFLNNLFSTHPPIEERIRILREEM